jgi:uncharacterized protein
VDAPTPAGIRRLSIPAFVAIVVVDLAILQGVGLLAQTGLDGFDHGHFRTSEQVALGLLLPVGLSVVFVYAVVAALGWWRPVSSRSRLRSASTTR